MREPEAMPAKERRRLDKELEAQAQAQASQIQYDPDIPALIMTVMMQLGFVL